MSAQSSEIMLKKSSSNLNLHRSVYELCFAVWCIYEMNRIGYEIEMQEKKSLLQNIECRKMSVDPSYVMKGGKILS